MLGTVLIAAALYPGKQRQKTSWGWELKREESRLAIKCTFLMERINNHQESRTITRQIPHRVKSQNGGEVSASQPGVWG